jgi:hypothetical protein
MRVRLTAAAGWSGCLAERQLLPSGSSEGTPCRPTTMRPSRLQREPQGGEGGSVRRDWNVVRCMLKPLPFPASTQLQTTAFSQVRLPSSSSLSSDFSQQLCVLI